MHSHEWDNKDLAADLDKETQDAAEKAFRAGYQRALHDLHELATGDALHQAFSEWWWAE